MKKLIDTVKKNPIMAAVWGLLLCAGGMGIFLLYWLMTLSIH